MQGGCLVLVVSMAIGQAAVAAQQPPSDSVTFKSETRAVQINVSVKDAEGRPVRGIRKEDFAVTDNGKPREIQLFSGDEEGNAAQTASAPPKGVFSNRFGPRTAPARITAIVIDTLISQTLQGQGRQNAIRAVERMRSGETVAVYAICPQLRILHDYTPDGALVLASLKAFVPVTPLWTAWLPDPFGKELSALRDVAAHMSAASGRKSIVWISTGFPSPARLDGISPNFRAHYRATVQAFNDANVALYPIDPRGVVGLNDNVQSLMDFAQETGGSAFYMRNDLDQAIVEALDDTQYTYELGFYLSAADFNGNFHELTVRVPEQPKLVLHYRRGYSTSPSSPSGEGKPELFGELLDAADSSGVGIDATLKVVSGAEGKELQVSLALAAATIGIGKGGAAAVDETFLEFRANGGRVGRVEESLQLQLPAGLETVRYARTVKLADGAATLKIIVRDRATGHIGSLSVPLTGLVP